MNPFPTIREIRQRFNLSQLEFAIVLQTSRTLLNKAEKGQRRLNEFSWNRLVEYEKKSRPVEIRQREANTISHKCTAKMVQLVQEWKRRLIEIGCQRIILELQLKNLKNKQASLAYAHANIDLLLEKIPGSHSPISLLARKKLLTENKHIACSASGQLRIQVKIDLLSAEAEILNRYLKGAQKSTDD
jgi:transcriptional regulator with XRE-family HTH domain